MSKVTGKIGKSAVSIRPEDMTNIPADAYIVPQFTEGVSLGGVGGAMREHAEKGMLAYQQHVADNGKPLELATAVLKESGGGKSKYLLHVVSMVDGERSSFDDVQKSFYNALLKAEEKGITSIVAPALGTGIRKDLTPRESALALMSAVDKYDKENRMPLTITFATHTSKEAHQEFAEVLKSKTYANKELLKTIAAAVKEEEPRISVIVLQAKDFAPVTREEPASRVISTVVQEAEKKSSKGKIAAIIGIGAAAIAAGGWAWNEHRKKEEKAADTGQSPSP